MPTETKCVACTEDMALTDGGAGITCENVRQKATGALSVAFFQLNLTIQVLCLGLIFFFWVLDV